LFFKRADVSFLFYVGVLGYSGLDVVVAKNLNINYEKQ